jgi:hypothetical protein
VLIAYPLVIALLIGLTAAYANAKPRVRARRLDTSPRSHRRRRVTFDVDALIHEVAKNVELVRMSEDEAAASSPRAGRGGVHDPAGFIDDAEGARRQPAPRRSRPARAGSRRACASRCRRSSTT